MTTMKTANNIDKHIGKKIKDTRNDLNINQTNVADKCGVTYQQLQKYERGESRVSASRLCRISKALKKPVQFFFPDKFTKGLITERIVYPPNHNIIMFSAFRYALGRQTYVVSEVVEYLLNHWETLEQKYRVLVIKEIYESIENGDAGMEIDIRQWCRLLIDHELGDKQRPIKVKEDETN